MNKHFFETLDLSHLQLCFSLLVLMQINLHRCCMYYIFAVRRMGGNSVRFCFVAAAQISLVSQNVMVVLCAGCFFVFFHFELFVLSWSQFLCQTTVVLLSVVADLASLARMLAVERDWIVKMCGPDTEKLASKNYATHDDL